VARRSTPKSAKADGDLPLEPQSYAHPEAKSFLRPDVGTQAQFKKRKPPTKYRYDSSIAPELSWDGQNGARELGEWLLQAIDDASKLPTPHRFPTPRQFVNGDKKVEVEVSGLADAVAKLKAMSRPFLNWAGKAERTSFDVPTLPLFVHERLSTKAILETLKKHKRDKQATLFELFGDPELPIHSQVLKAYEHVGGWTNRMILGDSLVVMNSLLKYEGLGGQVQMIYMDPPYGVKFGSNFQPFVRKRDVKHGDDADMTREPEMVKAYRDTWELGLHSYLSYFRDRLLLARDLLSTSGSIFVQISEENIHHLRELLDEVFGPSGHVSIITFKKTTGAGSPSLGTEVLPSVTDFVLWYCRDRDQVHYKQLYLGKSDEAGGVDQYTWIELKDGSRRRMTAAERGDWSSLPDDSRIFRADNLTAQSGVDKTRYEVTFEGRSFRPPKGVWKTSEAGMHQLIEHKRLIAVGDTLSYVRYLSDFPARPLNNTWDDTVTSGYADPKRYVVQTNPLVIQRCMLMSTGPGDLVIDPTCGSGSTAMVAEQWGRRWITIDTSRVPLALARQRLLTATFPYYTLKDSARGPAGDFAYRRKQNKHKEDVGGIVPHVTLKSVANNEPTREEVLVDRPEQDDKITRVTGPFAFEATIPTPINWDDQQEQGTDALGAEDRSFPDRLIEVLRRSPVLAIGGGKTVTLENVRQPAKTLSLSAEAAVSNGEKKPVALAFGPENGAISQLLVANAAQEAAGKRYTHLYLVGFAIQANARELVENCEAVYGVPATYVQATPDLLMGDLLKNLRTSQIFSVCGLPDVALRRAKSEKGDPTRYEVELRGLDVFDPATMENVSMKGDDVPAWFLDADYNGLCFHVTQAFFPRTAAWTDLKKSLKGQYEDRVWDHLAGTTSAPFEGGEHGQIAVKVIDDRGNELLVVRTLAEAEK
jgi:adenine-specific DNA-methyltransferase